MWWSIHKFNNAYLFEVERMTRNAQNESNLHLCAQIRGPMETLSDDVGEVPPR